MVYLLKCNAGIIPLLPPSSCVGLVEVAVAVNMPQWTCDFGLTLMKDILHMDPGDFFMLASIWAHSPSSTNTLSRDFVTRHAIVILRSLALTTGEDGEQSMEDWADGIEQLAVDFRESANPPRRLVMGAGWQQAEPAMSVVTLEARDSDSPGE